MKLFLLDHSPKSYGVCHIIIAASSRKAAAKIAFNSESCNYDHDNYQNVELACDALIELPLRAGIVNISSYIE